MAKFSMNSMVLNTLLGLHSQRSVIRGARGLHSIKSVSLYLHLNPLWTKGFPVKLTYCECFKRSYGLLSTRITLYSPTVTLKRYATTPQPDCDKPEPKPTLYQRFKSMYRDYWYVLLPVHMVTSAAWFAGFYYMASSGVDIVALLEQLSVSEKILNPLRNGHATSGYLAITFAIYKIATPLRYTVTLGGTTLSINYLKRWGYIKPVPTTERLKEMYQDKKVIFKEKGLNLKDNVMHSLKQTAND